MLSGKTFVICGLSRLSARVAHALQAEHASVTAIMYDTDKPSLKMILPPGVLVLNATAESAATTLRQAGLERAECLLALSEDDITNLRSTVSARSIVPNLPVVMRAFDPLLAEQFEKGFGVRRAYSVSALAAPSFIAAAAGGDILSSLRLGKEVIPICLLQIKKDSPLVGKTLAEIENEHEVKIIAEKTPDSEWRYRPADEGQSAAVAKAQKTFGVRRAFGTAPSVKPHQTKGLQPGDEIVFGGTQQKTLTTLIHADGWYRRRERRKENFGRGAGGGSSNARKRAATGARRSLTWMPRLIVGLVTLIVISIVLSAYVFHLSPVDAIYFVISTMTTLGDSDIDLKNYPGWVKLFQCVILLNGGALLGLSFSFLTTMATAERLEVTMARQAERMRGHVVVVGLGNVGYRVIQALSELGLEACVMDLEPPRQFYDVASRLAPILSGDARLPDNLERISIRDAEALIACTSNDVANVETCLHARRMNPKIRTIARVFDNQIVGTVATAFNIDRVLSATSIAEPSFVTAASDMEAIRTMQVGDFAFSAVKYLARVRIAPSDVEAWRNQGVYTLAFRSDSGTVTPTLGFSTTHEVVVCGPADKIHELLDKN